MLRNESSPDHAATMDIPRGGGAYDYQPLGHSAVTENCSGSPPTGTNDSQRVRKELKQSHEEQSLGNEGWIFPPIDKAFSAHSLDTLWTRPDLPLSPSDVHNRNSLPPTSTGNKIRVASAAGSSPISPFNHHQQHANFSSGRIPDQSPTNSANYSYFNQSNHQRDSSEITFNHPASATTTAAPMALPALPITSLETIFATNTSQNNKTAVQSTLWWGELEPWMDEEYAKKVCDLMGWDKVSVKIPHTPADNVTGQHANNPGYCFLTFPTPDHAAGVLAQINNATASGTQPILPNSNKPFVLNWASSPSPSPATQPFSINTPINPSNNNITQGQKEYSIFVGDLAPETSNSDLVAVFRNPVLGLRNDRAPKFIRPFYSCKSAKIMLDPVTGVSRGYGFVRFTDEADQQRALIEMHGLYCLSRPSTSFLPHVKGLT